MGTTINFEPPDLVTSVAGRAGAVVLAEADVAGLGADLAGKAPLASPTFTGVPLLPAVLPYVRTPQAASARQVLDSQPEPRYPDRLIVPPAALLAASAAAVWYVANAVTLMRFGLSGTRTTNTTVNHHGLATGITTSRTCFTATNAGGVTAAFSTMGTTTRWVSGLTLEAGMLPMVLLGDSIVANDGSETTDWFSDADELTGYRFYPATNAGVAGETTAQILARTAAAVVGMRYAVVLGGTNDVRGATTSATTIANLTAIYNAIAAAGATFLACTIPPCTGLSAGQATNLRAVNAWIRANYATWAGARLCDWSWALSDGTDESAPLAANFSDGVHPNTVGCAIMSALLIKSIRDWI